MILELTHRAAWKFINLFYKKNIYIKEIYKKIIIFL